MTEFKVNKQFSKQITALRKSSDDINDSYSKVSSDGVSTLKTSKAYIQQHKDIKALLDQYKSLLLRDAQDLDDMVKEFDQMDSAFATSYK